MTEEPKKPETTEEPTADQQPKDEQQPETEARHEEGLKDMTEKIWDATRKTFTTATFKAGQYRRIVQKKIDLASLHKKIDAAHGDLGQLVSAAHEAGEAAILEKEDVRQLLEKLDGLKQSAAVIEHEIEMIKAEEPEEKPDESQTP
ncbi:hypothetical protein [Geoalkalibacter sp.]|uniref:hypothetical protein n=1 Tax=Geoalkalibacter sp. TaxID=3041440 RepID=UPI00272EA647|nr:hypothetical protein [Geoalkalibacter sp.]